MADKGYSISEAFPNLNDSVIGETISASVSLTTGRQEGNKYGIIFHKCTPLPKTSSVGREATTGIQQRQAGHTVNVKEAKDGRWLAQSIRMGLLNNS